MDLHIEYQPIESAQLATNNPKAHDVGTIKASILRWGFCELPAIDERTGRLIAGHGRREALLAIQQDGHGPPAGIKTDEDGRWLWPVLRGNTFATQEDADAYLVATNNAVIKGGWDPVRLAKLLDAVRSKTELTGTGFTVKDLDRMLTKTRDAKQVKEDDVDSMAPTEESTPITKSGDIWVLGEHRIACGDCRDAALLDRLMGGELADMLHSDPPYGMGKESDGVVGDNQYGDQLDAFNTEWWSAARKHLKEVAACYVWGNALELWRWWVGHLARKEVVTFRNEIVWDKEKTAAMTWNGMTKFAPTTERCLFFGLGNQGGIAPRSKAPDWDGWAPVKEYLAAEVGRLGLSDAELRAITEAKSLAWLRGKQWQMPSERVYSRLEAAGFSRPWSTLKAQYEALKSEHKAWIDGQRAFHDNSHTVMGEVWRFPSVSGPERYGHATPKPVAMMARELLSSCPTNGIVLSPFGGTGPEVIAAEQTNRRARLVELQPKYVDVVVRRWELHTGGKARLLA